MARRAHQSQRRSDGHQRQVEELRRSNAAGTHGDNGYSRKEKHPIDWLDEDNWE